MGWISAAALAALSACWVLYPVAVWLVAQIRRPIGIDKAARGDVPSTVSFVVATREDPQVVRDRIDNLFATQTDTSLDDVIVSVDVSSAWRVDTYQSILPPGVRVAGGDPPGGKAATLNAGVRMARHDIVVFTDSAQRFVGDASVQLLRCFDNAVVGAASGRLAPKNNARSLAMRAYWAYELWLRRLESDCFGLVGVTGAIYAIRRAAWQPMPSGLILDDVYVALVVAQQGLRVVHCDDARATDPREFTVQQEFVRKVRTQTGLLQLCTLRGDALNPLRSRLAAAFVFHKLMRVATPWLACLALGAFIVDHVPATAVMAGVAVGAVAWSACHAMPRTSRAFRIAEQVRWAALLFVSPMVATVHALRGDWNVWGGAASVDKR